MSNRSTEEPKQRQELKRHLLGTERKQWKAVIQPADHVQLKKQDNQEIRLRQRRMCQGGIHN